MEKPIRVLVVDDSRTIRALIKRSFGQNPDIVVCGEAANPIEARDLIIQDQPDVITLDVEMPGMNGLQFLEKIMRLRPIPVVMVSSLTARGADTAITALQMGAFDCFPKPSSVVGADAFAGLARLVIQAARSHPVARLPRRDPASPPRQHADWGHSIGLIAIGASTGGVEAIEEVLSGFPAQSPPIVICQHMPALFTASFANRLDQKIAALSIGEARDGEVLAPGVVRIAPGGDRHTVVERRDGRYVTRLVKSPPVSGHCPSVDVLFGSVARQAGNDALGIILTGMGQDGAEGLLAMRHAGAQTIAQDKASAVVYGMPRIAAEIGAASRIVPLCQISAAAMTVHTR
ncbi:protein-glutamate methylesterase/protein-glutamine glutaminase [Gluconacetobacter diazotrophicus]|uniref:Protein-glutamate methylesterase/protein-glutamine glutaminase n=2 Tax=Gluconacetobacter diazotrophicus TaxID=33996 RepID=A9HHG0_GLUDA|nr:chemotaxis response regulator protein-glutamate methylesterase [Gluconacetobacter diazotrophicus]MBB2156054.1 chemotaxis response regulator protein-glutamate methylesterase [Gluconacetobacter diazotrophicus]TWB10431.1 two-component system chemotaxis response regulator CheB [Gluconacetobacter diazotrophicus]CAP55631.1 putative chemotaxis response regulator protein-glutamate methylesterase o group 1 operon [Gluconacetobacter diazotrophicus PA1 5]